MLGSTKLLLGLSAVVALGLACASRVPSAKEYRNGLTLVTAVSRSAATVGEPLDFTQTLKNTSAQTLEACLGEARTYHIFGTTNDDGQVSAVDHERCVQRFRLEPGQELAWSDSVPLGNVGLGPAKLYTSVSIVVLEGCSAKYGCYNTSVSSQFVPFEVVPGSQRAK